MMPAPSFQGCEGKGRALILRSKAVTPPSANPGKHPYSTKCVEVNDGDVSDLVTANYSQTQDSNNFKCVQISPCQLQKTMELPH
jgi:hypothetical protein